MGCANDLICSGRNKNVSKGGKQNARQSVGQRQSDKHAATDEPGMNIMCGIILNIMCGIILKGVRGATPL